MRLIVAILLLLSCTLIQAGHAMPEHDPERQARDARYEEHVRELADGPTTVLEYRDLLSVLRGYRVIVVGGYSALDYEHPDILKAQIFDLVKRNGDKSVYILGGTTDGIGKAYSWISQAARESGFGDIQTAGIVSRNAVDYGVAAQDYIVFVDTPVDDWQVLVDGRSLMVDVAKQAGGEMVYFRGGAVSRAEIEEALAQRVPVTVYTGDGLAPKPERMEKRLKKDPHYVVDGTQGFVEAPLSASVTSPLTIVVIDRDGHSVPFD